MCVAPRCAPTGASTLRDPWRRAAAVCMDFFDFDEDGAVSARALGQRARGAERRAARGAECRAAQIGMGDLFAGMALQLDEVLLGDYSALAEMLDARTRAVSAARSRVVAWR